MNPAAALAVEPDNPAPPPAPAPARRRSSGIEIALGVVAVAVLAAHLAGARGTGGVLWGADAWAHLPGGSLAVGLAALAAALTVALRSRGGFEPILAVAAAPRRARWSGRWLGLALLGAACGAVFWGLRCRHVLLGDGIPIAALLPEAHEIHAREPLGHLLQRWLYDAFQPLFAAPGRPRSHVVRDCVALGSVLAGVGFVGAARALAREMAAAWPAAGARAGALAGWTALVFLSQGYVQLFFGYVENYAWPALAIACYLAAGLACLRGAVPLALPLAVAGLALALSLASVVLAPSLAALVAAAMIDPARRRAALRDLALAAAAAAAAVVWLERGPAGYPVLAHLQALLAGGRGDPGYLMSAEHARDFLNGQMLIGPLGLFLFVPLAVVLAAGRRIAGARTWFLVAAGGGAAAACWSVPDLPMGYARDWDLFAPPGVALAAAGLGLLLVALREPAARRRALVAAAAVSLFHTVPWIALNTSETRSLARFKTLPLGQGRTENTVAYWHAERGEHDEARRWLERSLAVHPGNTRAIDLYGRIAFEQGDAPLAVRAYLIAVTLRPEKQEFRRQLEAAVAASGGPAAALAEVDRLLAAAPDAAPLLRERAALLRAAGRAAAADSALALARHHEPAAREPAAAPARHGAGRP